MEKSEIELLKWDIFNSYLSIAPTTNHWWQQYSSRRLHSEKQFSGWFPCENTHSKTVIVIIHKKNARAITIQKAPWAIKTKLIVKFNSSIKKEKWVNVFQEINGRGLSNAKFETMRREEMLSAIFVLRFLRVEPRTYCMGALTNCKSTILLISWCHIRTLRMLPYSLYCPVLACTFS